MGTRVRHPKVVLDVTRKTPTPTLIIYARHVTTQMQVPGEFSALASEVTNLSANTDALEIAQTQALTKAKGTADARDVVAADVHNNLEELKGKVQLMVNADPANAAVIASAAGMRIKARSAYSKPELQAVMTGVPGQVKLVAKAAGRRASYLWEYSLDGSTWVTIGSSTEANITVSGLTVTSAYSFRFNTTIKHTTGAWSQVIRALVH